MAMLAGIRVAFDSMLAEFDPDYLQEAFDRQLGEDPREAPGDWDLYREKHPDIEVPRRGKLSPVVWSASSPGPNRRQLSLLKASYSSGEATPSARMPHCTHT